MNPQPLAAVTGATGFVGSHLVDRLRADGWRVRCLARPGRALPWPDVERVEGGLDDTAALRRLVAGAGVVHHVAGAVAAASEAAFLEVNREGTARVVDACAAERIARLVHVSSLAVTGPSSPGHPRDEAGAPQPVTPYGRSKLAAEQVVRASGIPFTIVRPPVVYGSRDAQLLRLFRVARLGLVPLLGDGRQELSLVHAADLAAALVAAAHAPACIGGTYHAAHAQPVDQRELASLVARSVGRERALRIPLPAPLVRAGLHLARAGARLTGGSTLLGPDKAPEFLAAAWTCSSEALAHDAGWRAATAHEDGFRATAAWYRSQGWL